MSSDALSRFMTTFMPTVRFQSSICTMRCSVDLVMRRWNCRGMPDVPSSVMFLSVL